MVDTTKKKKEEDTKRSCMISWIIQRIVLSDFNTNATSPLSKHQEETIVDFLENQTSTKLFAFAFPIINNKNDDNNNNTTSPLCLSNDLKDIFSTNNTAQSKSGYPKDVAYFVKPKAVQISPENINDIIQFGTFATEQTPSSLFRLMNEFYTPFIFSSCSTASKKSRQEKSWPASTREELIGHYHKFMASLTENVTLDSIELSDAAKNNNIDSGNNSSYGKTILYLPFHKENEWLFFPDDENNNSSKNGDTSVSSPTSSQYDPSLQYFDYSSSSSPSSSSIKNKKNNNTAVRQLESIVIHWTKQIKKVLNEYNDSDGDFVVGHHDTSTSSSKSKGPLEEIQYWKMRAHDLSGISKQLGISQQEEANNEENKENININNNQYKYGVSYIIDTLRNHKSAHLEPLLQLTQQLDKGIKEANENIKHLSILQDPCEKLSKFKHPKEVSSTLLRQVLYCVLFISKHSEFYRKNKDRVCFGLLRKISNEIIQKCQSIISLDNIFLSFESNSSSSSGEEAAGGGNSLDDGIQSLRDSIDCCVKWKKVYHQVTSKQRQKKEGSSQTQNNNTFSWDFDDVSIFAQMDAFVQRCFDLLDVCYGQKQFSLNGGQKLNLGNGYNGEMINKSLKDIQLLFLSHLRRLHDVPYNILNVTMSISSVNRANSRATWHYDYKEFKHAIQDLDVMYINLLHSIFEPIQKIEEALYLFDIFSSPSRTKRPKIKSCMESIGREKIQALFLQKCANIQNEFDTNRRRSVLLKNSSSSVFPLIFGTNGCGFSQAQFSGTALWAQSLIDCIIRLWEQMQKLSASISLGSFLGFHLCNDETETCFLKLLDTLRAYQTQRHKDWIESLTSALSQNETTTTSATNHIIEPESKLDRPLLTKFYNKETTTTLTSSGSNSKFKFLLESNFDSALQSMFQEVHYWEKLNSSISSSSSLLQKYHKLQEGEKMDFDIPHFVLGICQQAENLRVVNEKVMSLVYAYNDLVNDLLSPSSNNINNNTSLDIHTSEENQENLTPSLDIRKQTTRKKNNIDDSDIHLFSDHLRKLEKKIRPGISKKSSLTWSSRPLLIDRFIQSCLKEIQNVHSSLKLFHQQKSNIYKVCSQVSLHPFIFILHNQTEQNEDEYCSFKNITTYDIGIFESKQSAHLEETKVFLQDAHKQIIMSLDKMFQCCAVDGLPSNNEIMTSTSSSTVSSPHQGTPPSLVVSREVQYEWKSLVDYVDNLAEDSLLKAVKESLLSFSEAILNLGIDPMDMTNSVDYQQEQNNTFISSMVPSSSHEIENEQGEALFNIKVILDNRVECRPTMIDVTHAVNATAKDLICVLDSVPRLVQEANHNPTYYQKADDVVNNVDRRNSVIPKALNENNTIIGKTPVDTDVTNNKVQPAVGERIPETVYKKKKKKNEKQVTFYHAISANDDILQIIVRIMNDMASTARKVHKEIMRWDQLYKPLWEMDKDSFLRRYAKQANRPLEVYERDIMRHVTQERDMMMKEKYKTISFIKLNYASLKSSLRDHCIEWELKLTGLLKQNAESQLSEIHSLLETNTEKLSTVPQDLPSLKAMMDCFYKVTNKSVLPSDSNVSSKKKHTQEQNEVMFDLSSDRFDSNNNNNISIGLLHTLTHEKVPQAEQTYRVLEKILHIMQSASPSSGSSTVFNGAAIHNSSGSNSQLPEKNDTIVISENEREMLDSLKAKLEMFQGTIDRAEVIMQKSKKSLRSKFDESIKAHRQRGKELKDFIISSMVKIVSSQSSIEHESKDEKSQQTKEKKKKSMKDMLLEQPENALNQIDVIFEQIEKRKRDGDELSPGSELFGIDLPPEDKGLEESIKYLNLFKKIWTYAKEWKDFYNQQKLSLVRAIDIDLIEKYSNNFSRTLNKFRREINNNSATNGKERINTNDGNSVLNCLRDKVEEFKQVIPILQNLRCEAFRKRHWNLLKQYITEHGERKDDEVGDSTSSFEPSSLTLGDVFDRELFKHSDFINDLSGNASKEMNMEKQLSEISLRWKEEMKLDIVDYKKTYYKIRSTDDLFTALEDDTVSISTMKRSKFYKTFQDDIDLWERVLSTISEVLDIYLVVQRKWLYLESIFLSSGGGDINKQLPDEYSLFCTVHEKFFEAMVHTHENPIAKESFYGPDDQPNNNNPASLENLNDMDEKLEQIQKSLDQYLEVKRMVFPRFYFVSDDDLLEILGKSKEPLGIQKHIKKCFEGVHSLKMFIPGSNSENSGIATKSSAVAIVSAGLASDGEILEFVQNVPLEGPVENWFVDILQASKIAVQKALLGCIISFKKLKKQKDQWVRDWHGQLLITTGAIAWTTNCTKALNSISSGRDKYAMRTLKKKQVVYLRRLTDLVRDPDLSKIDRTKLVALITMEIHNRDVIERLIKNRCKEPQSFTWLSQLRFIFESDCGGPFGKCSVRQTNCVLPYSYEYQGNNGRLVVTPLTDRCVLTLLTAMFLHRGGNPLGPAGTGKTETVKDLAKNLAQYCVVSNCSDGMDYKSVGRIFSGLCQSGCWGCFDEFNRIKIEVISVVAMQVLSILNAQRAGLKEFSFMGNIIPCSKEAGIFITMNPGYAGRTELPDNLKALMRPVAMMAPDLNLIAEVMLAAEGFSEARNLAKKTITLYSLMQQQLSKQDHYDYGLRNLKAVLNMAGSLKRDDPSLNEEIILLRALRDMNLPKFKKDDLRLFLLLLGDLFPGLDLPSDECGALKVAVEQELDRHGLQRHSSLVEKVLELHNSQLTRHCNMLVGQTMSGKSTVWKILAAAKIALAKENNNPNGFVNQFVINPKSITLSELYGEYDLQTFEWADGILSTIFKQCSESEKTDEKWILFDGPVDALWIESMNSVMDDNKILTLINGDRIPLTNSMSLLFEVEDLSVASPATVSRAGMIYLDSSDMGWEPFVDSWLQRTYTDSEDDRNFHRNLFKKYVTKILDFKRQECQEPVPTNDFNAVQSLVNLYSALITSPENGVEKGVGKESKQKFYELSEKWFIFSVVWSIMASVDEKSRELISGFLRDITTLFPTQHTVYDYFIDPTTQEFKLWETVVPSTTPASDLPFQQIFIPTVDTVRNSYVLSALVKKQHHVLLTGSTGVGKSVLVQSMLEKIPEKYASLQINFSSATSSGATQMIIESSMQKRAKNKIGPFENKQLVIFIDDFNMPKKTSSESPFQPPLELIRMVLDYGGWYDRTKCSWQYVLDTQFVSAMAPPTGGREIISKRTQSRFFLLNYTQPNDKEILNIFQTILRPKLEVYHGDVDLMGSKIVTATLGVYNKVLSDFLPTPLKSQYQFNLRDVSKVVQGMLQACGETLETKDKILRLWVHECMRSFSDRFLNDHSKDEHRFLQIVSNILKVEFDTEWDDLMKDSISASGPIFANFSKSSSGYKEIGNFDTLLGCLSESLEDYNSESKLVPMNLVLFEDAIRHICRIHRVLQLDQGNMMLIGVGGSGRQSLARLASYISDIDVFTIEITNAYKLTDFREDLKVLYNRCGVENKSTVFLFNDNQIKDEDFLEDINNILSSGQVPNLFQKDELVNIFDNIRADATQAGMGNSQNALWKFFINRVRANLHVLLTMSPIGSALRSRCRMFPGLVNCTTIDYFNEWPKEALQEVAEKFLNDTGFGDEKNEKERQKLSESFASIHLSSIETSEKMKNELKRFNYITPTNYLELVKGYVQLRKEKQRDLDLQKSKLSNGLLKLELGREQVETMSIELEKKKEDVAKSQVECENMLEEIAFEKHVAEEQRREVEAESKKIAVEEKECKAIADEAAADLAIALPALERAMAEVDKLDKNAISEIKAYSKPPAAVEKVLSCVMILLGKPTDWANAKKVVGETSFLSGLKSFDKGNVKDSIIAKVKKFVTSPSFAAEEITKISKAAGALCFWCHAIYVYAGVSKEVAPKRARLKAAEEGLKAKQLALTEAQNKLDEVVAKVKSLKERYDSSVQEKNRLKAEADSLEEKLNRAEKLINGLSGEYSRWQKSVGVFNEKITALVGDALIASGFLSYAGPFDTVYRESLVSRWSDTVKMMGLPYSEGFNFSLFLSDPTDVREWNIQGLPNDNFSTENGVTVTRCRRWPLLIDPQGQANKWIKNMEGEELKIIDLKMKDFLRVIENAIVYGLPVLLQDIHEEIDPSLEPVLSKSTIKIGGRNVIRLGDKEIDYNNDFRLYISTKLSNPHFAPEISTKTTVVNFSVKQQGLEDQLLGIVVNQEEPELEQRKSDLTLRVAAGNKKLVELEDDILRKLAESEGSLLDNVELVKTLQISKITAEEVTEQLKVARETEAEIDKAREGYRPAAVRSSIIYFVLNDMSKVDPMYQYSLDSYADLFIKSIINSREESKGKISLLKNSSDGITISSFDRAQEINEYHTLSVYNSTCVGLFERHKLLFSLQLCFRIMMQEGLIPKEEFDFFCFGGVSVDQKETRENPYSDWMSSTAWENLKVLEKITPFDGEVYGVSLAKCFKENPKAWKEWCLSGKPEDNPLPEARDCNWNEKLSLLQKMCLVRALRPDRVIFMASQFVSKSLGPEYADPPSFNLQKIFGTSSHKTPLIFILSPGVDPTEQVQQLANSKKKNLVQVALGQGQGPVASRAVASAVKTGSWVLLANCHLMLGWMIELEKIVENLSNNNNNEQEIHPEFRLWLSSSPNPNFPMSLLQRGIKMTTEAPRGLRANLMKLYGLITTDKFNLCEQREKYKKLLFSLSWFHALLLERRKFKSLGFNIPYDFNDSDYLICHDLVAVLLDEYKQQTPFEALRYLIAEANYGGRVTDNMDRRLVNVYMKEFFCEDAIEKKQYKLSELNQYFIPEDGTFDSYKDYIRGLPLHDHPNAFGQHPNADISSQIEETNDLLSTVITLQPSTIVSGDDSTEEMVLKQIGMMDEKFLETFDLEEIKSNMEGRPDPEALKVVLFQEIARYNTLLSLLKKEINQLKKAMVGQIVMTSSLEAIMLSILEHKVPSSWSIAYPSTKPLGSWIRDLGMRIDQIKGWVNDKLPSVFWLSGFTYPSGFLTAVLQTTARSNGVAIDSLTWEFSFPKNEAEIKEGPKEGAYISGLFIEGAKWDTANDCIMESLPMELSSSMPIIHFKPVDNKNQQKSRSSSSSQKNNKGSIYNCPLYMYPVRTGTRERPSFVMTIDVKSAPTIPEGGQNCTDVISTTPNHWIKRGVAMLLSTSD